ncbi:hypothetical protein [Microbacterium oxydans]|uniref:hypothetical protein n=1 Tax=Microbacterium oxydans TaxID=82380 RepID=UPI0022B0F8CE|nr:hypothetical protein [Microbacterium oxydans]MCZ4300268.1 hypothetical protein [Microbacterium oxydans]
MSQKLSVGKSVIGALAVGVLVAIAGCAPTPQSTPEPSAAPVTPTPDPYAGPIAFVGDELDWFLLSADEIAGMLPDVGEVSPAVSSLIQVSDGGGPEPVPAICSALAAETSLGSIGARSVTWTTAEEGSDGWLHVLQFADEEAAKARMDQYVDAAAQCVEFEFGGPATFASSTAEGQGGIRALAGSLIITYSTGGGYSVYTSYVSVGNVIVEVWQPFTGEPAFDAEAAAALLRDRAEEARRMLIDDLTANPPAPVETPAAADPAAPWSAWQITPVGVGPVQLGVELDEAIAAVPGARIQEPEWEGGPTRLIAADESASLLLETQEGGTLVSALTVGIANTAGDRSDDGAALPSADGVKVGDPVSAAVTAFPEGTDLRIVSSGEYFYEWSTREGVTLRFRLDRDSVGDDGAVITGITLEDATLGKAPIFG